MTCLVLNICTYKTIRKNAYVKGKPLVKEDFAKLKIRKFVGINFTKGSKCSKSNQDLV